MRVENDVWNQMIRGKGHFVNREELGDNSLAAKTRREFVSLFQVASGSQFNSYINDILLVLHDMHVFHTGRVFVLIEQRSIVFGFILPLRLFLSDQDIILLDPSSNLNDSVLELRVVASFIRRLRETNRSDVFLTLNLRIYKSVVHAVEQALVH